MSRLTYVLPLAPDNHEYRFPLHLGRTDSDHVDMNTLNLYTNDCYEPAKEK